MLTSVTVKAFPSSEFAFANVAVSTSAEDDDAFWDAVTNVVAEFPL